jgi:hypothetical protein
MIVFISKAGTLKPEFSVPILDLELGLVHCYPSGTYIHVRVWNVIAFKPTPSTFHHLDSPA